MRRLLFVSLSLDDISRLQMDDMMIESRECEAVATSARLRFDQ